MSKQRQIGLQLVRIETIENELYEVVKVKGEDVTVRHLATAEVRSVNGSHVMPATPEDIKSFALSWQLRRAKSKPYYERDGIKLYHGDALAILPLLESQSFGSVLLDPPYSMTPNSVRGKDDGAAGTNAAPTLLFQSIAAESKRLLQRGGIAAFICDWRRVPDVSYQVSLTGLRLATTVAWVRTVPGTGGLFRSSWDPILIASRGAADYIDRAAIRNVIEANPPARRSHPYEKPVELWTHLLQRLPEAPVLDPFAGSASSAGAALQLGRPWTGIEVDEQHCEAIAKKLDSLQ